MITVCVPVSAKKEDAEFKEVMHAADLFRTKLIVSCIWLLGPGIWVSVCRRSY